MNHFVQLPSGMRANPSHIVYYGQSEHEGQIKLVMTDEATPWLETMTLEQLDALLQPQSPIVDPVINLDRLKETAACQFTYEGQVKYGVIEEIGYSDSLGDSFIRFRSDGEAFTLWPSDGEVNRD